MDAIIVANRRMGYLLCAGSASLMWSVVAPSPAWLVVAFNAIVPLLALELYRRQHEIFTLWDIKFNSAKPAIGMILLLPGAALALMAFQSKLPMSWALSALGTIALSLGLAALFGTGRKGLRNLVTGALLLVPYAFGMMLLVSGQVN